MEGQRRRQGSRRTAIIIKKATIGYDVSKTGNTPRKSDHIYTNSQISNCHVKALYAVHSGQKQTTTMAETNAQCSWKL